MKLFDSAVVRILPAVPRSVVRRVASPYIAGPSLADARATVRALNTRGKLATVDVLGEELHSPAEAEAIARAYHAVLAAIAADGLDANISVKLTGLGLKLDPELCRTLLADLVRAAAARGTFVRIDMEDSSTTDETIAIYRLLREDGHENVGLVLQAVLRRTLADIDALAELRPNVRLCKGIYVEPTAIAFREFDVIRRSFVACLEALLRCGSYVGIATHDEWLVVQSLARTEGLDPLTYEFQMLLGVREARATALVAGGHRVRIYVPYGQHWYEYSLRRLQENPKVAGYVARDVLGRVVPGLSQK
ncbi:MAG: proline dehydrogenase family protein [Gaiella sp.]